MRVVGEIAEGRPNLGDQMPVMVYRLLEVSIFDVLTKKYGIDTANDLFREAGKLSGISFAKSNLPKDLPADDFLVLLQEKLKDLKIGILRIESADFETGELKLSVYEDLDCSGLPVTDETVCVYDEGFLAGILEFYTDKPFIVREVDCWSSGSRVCRFDAKFL